MTARPGELDDTLRMLRESVAAFAQPDAQRSRTVRDAHQGFDRAVWNEMASMGWLSAVVPEAQGGLGLGLRAGVAIAQRLGYAGYFEPFVGVGVMAVSCLAACDDKRRLTAVMEGKQLTGLAWQPNNGSLDVDSTEVVAEHDGKVSQLSGVCRFVAVPQADAFIVAARDGNALGAYWVERDASGVSMKPERAADGTVLGLLTLDEVRVPDDSMLAKGDVAKRAMELAIESGIVVTAGELLGAIERSLDLTIDYLKTREQFGKPIGSFQALQHRAVDMWMQKELTQAALRSALNLMDDSDAQDTARRAAASSAKARASHAALYVCGQAVQLHGAIGFTDEYELGVYVNRAVTLAARYGNAAQHRRRYGSLVPAIER